jgi:sulfonate transport system substrate-binding protein
MTYAKILGLFLGTLLIVACGRGEREHAQRQEKSTQALSSKELRIATQPAPLYGPVFVAKRKGWLEGELKELGVTVKWSSFVAGPPENESFFAGNQDIGVLGDTPAIIAKSAGLKSRVIGVSANGPKALAIVARDGTQIERPEQLRGKKIGVTKGSYAHHLLALVLEKGNLKEEDVKIIHLPPADLVNAFNAGELDAASTWEPFLSRIEVGKARRIADGSGIKQGTLVIIAMDEFAKNNPEIVRRFLLAYRRGFEFIKEHPKEAANLIADEVKMEPQAYERLIPVFDYNPVITSDTYRELKATEAFLRSKSLTKNLVDIDAFVDTTYLRTIGLAK